MVTMGLSRTVSETAISVENRKFVAIPTHPAKGVPLELDIGARGQK